MSPNQAYAQTRWVALRGSRRVHLVRGATEGWTLCGKPTTGLTPVKQTYDPTFYDSWPACTRCDAAKSS
jgi:hypothetical protein